MDKNASLTISFLRFPLIYLVVLLHTFIVDEPVLGNIYITKGQFPLLECIEYIVKNCIADSAVPAMFIISGFLFADVKSLDHVVYVGKLKRRVNSLFVPYLFWNTTYIAFVLLVQLLFPSFVDERKFVWEFTINDWGMAYWELSQGLIPLWYIRDLICLDIVYPLLFLLIKRTRGVFVLILVYCYMTDILVWNNGLGVRSMLFYCLGIWFGMYNKNKIQKNDSLIFLLWMIYLLIVVVNIVLWKDGIFNLQIRRAVIIIGAISILSFGYYGVEKGLLSPKDVFVKGAFIVYVFHEFVIYLPGKFWVFIVPVNEITSITMLFIIPMITCLICLGCFHILKFLAPGFTRVIIGGR